MIRHAGRRRAREQANAGAVFVEILIGLPVLLALVFVLVGVGSLLNAKEALNSAVSNGLRLARTRGDSIRLRGPVAVQSLFSPQLIGPARCEYQQSLLQHDMPEPNIGAFAVMHEWNSDRFALHSYSCESFTAAFPYYYYLALLYTYESMRKSVPTVKYPCSPPSVPTTNAEAPAERRSGCLKCIFLNPLQAGIDPLAQTLYLGQSLINEPRFGMHCDYHPSDPAIRLASSLLSFLGGGNSGAASDVISVTAYSSVP